MKNSRRVQTHHCAYTPLLNSANNNIITQSTPFCNEPLPQFVKAIASIHQQCEFYDHILRGSKHPIFDSVRGFKSVGWSIRNKTSSNNKPHRCQ